MKRLFGVTAFILFISCKDARLWQYDKTIAEADSFSIYYRALDKTFSVPPRYIPNLRDVLVRNVKPEFQRKFLYEININVYKRGKQTAGMTITNNKTEPFITYRSDNTVFGFRMTYGLGMFLDNLSYELSHR